MHSQDHNYTLTLHVHNRPGVLVRVAQVYNRRGHNIESLHVAADPGNPELSTMTISASGKPEMMQQVIAQIKKLIDVLDVTVHED